jgi:hypothetical protein
LEIVMNLDREIGTEWPFRTVNVSKEDLAEYERLLLSALPNWAQVELLTLRAERDLLRRALVQYGNRQGMAMAPPDLHQAIDDAFASS